MKQQATVFKFQPFSKKQRQTLNWWTQTSPVKHYDGIIADGAIRSGKSLCMSLSFVMWAMSEFDGENFAMCGKSVGSFRRNVLGWLKQMLRGRGYEYADHRSDNLLTVWRGDIENHFYIFGGRDERSQDFIQGVTLAGVFLDEVALMPESFVNQATGRCSVDGSKLWFNCNPSYPSHWFKKEWIDKKDDKCLLYLHFTMEDNLSLSEKVKQRYYNMYTGIFRRRYIDGEWAMADGLVYPMHEEALGKPPEDSKASDYCLSIDYGTMNAFAAILWEKHKTTWYATRLYYYSGRDAGVQKTDSQYADEVGALIEDIMKARESKGGKSVLTQRTVFKKMKTIIDPSAASFIAELNRRKWYNIMKARNDVVDGIRETASAMHNGYIKIDPDMKEAISELEGYIWDESAEDRPVKINDHFCDAMRYAVYTNGWARQRR